MMKSAALFSVVGLIDSLLSALVVDSLTSTFHDPNRELVGQGMGNMASGLFGGVWGAGGNGASIVAIREGCTSAAAPMIQALVLLAIVCGLGPLAGYVPEAALAGILIKAGLNVIDWATLRRLRRFWCHRPTRRHALESSAVFLVTLFGAVFVDLILAVAYGSTLAAWLFVLKSRKHTVQYTQVVRIEGDKAVVRFKGPITFGCASTLYRGLLAQLADKKEAILDFREVSMIDHSACMTLENLSRALLQHGCKLTVCGLPPGTEGGPMLAVSTMLKDAINESPYDSVPAWITLRD